MGRRRFYPNQEGRFLIWDHAKDTRESLLFHVYGRVREVHSKEIELEPWTYVEPDIPPDQNVEPYAILKDSVQEFTPLAREPDWVRVVGTRKRPQKARKAPDGGGDGSGTENAS